MGATFARTYSNKPYTNIARSNINHAQSGRTATVASQIFGIFGKPNWFVQTSHAARAASPAVP